LATPQSYLILTFLPVLFNRSELDNLLEILPLFVSMFAYMQTNVRNNETTLLEVSI